ncbi:MAG: hypothetical protein Q9162_006248 [Coniocarpon cinnabarinum]
MHYALPPRTDKAPPYAPKRQNGPRWPRWLRRGRTPVLLAYAAGVIFVLTLIIHQLRGGSSKDSVPPGTPRAVIVTAFNQAVRGRYEHTIVENRELYAHMHGYGLFLANKTDYDLSDPPAPASWAKIPAMRHAMAQFPYSEYFFYLEQNALIMRPNLSIEEHLMNPKRLGEIMMIDKPVVPPSSVIHTFKNVKPENIDAVFTQDYEGLGPDSFVLRRGEWAKFFLDAWFDPLYRSYNFQRAEGHALEHLVQWHGTVLMKMALVPQRLLNSYTTTEGEGQYEDGDFVANFRGCDNAGSGRSCEKETEPLVEHLLSLKLDQQ